MMLHTEIVSCSRADSRPLCHTLLTRQGDVPSGFMVDRALAASVTKLVVLYSLGHALVRHSAAGHCTLRIGHVLTRQA